MCMVARVCGDGFGGKLRSVPNERRRTGSLSGPGHVSRLATQSGAALTFDARSYLVFISHLFKF